MMVYPRKIDLEGTSKLSTFDFTTVVESVDELIVRVKERLAFVSMHYDSVIQLSDLVPIPKGGRFK